MNYLLPEQILDYGVSHADEPRADMLRLLQAKLGYQHIQSVRKLTRNPDKDTNGTGERNPIARFETVYRIFCRRNLAAAILMRERFFYVTEIFMSEPMEQDERPFSGSEACCELTDLMTALQRAVLSGEPIATHLAQIEAAARLQQRRLTKSEIRKAQAAQSANRVNWRQGQRGL